MRPTQPPHRPSRARDEPHGLSVVPDLLPLAIVEPRTTSADNVRGIRQDSFPGQVHGTSRIHLDRHGWPVDARDVRCNTIRTAILAVLAGTVVWVIAHGVARAHNSAASAQVQDVADYTITHRNMSDQQLAGSLHGLYPNTRLTVNGEPTGAGDGVVYVKREQGTAIVTVTRDHLKVSRP